MTGVNLVIHFKSGRYTVSEVIVLNLLVLHYSL